MMAHIQVMTPCFGAQVTSLYTTSLLNLVMACQKRGLRIGWTLHGGDALITRARAECVAYFLSDPTPTHLLFIDADIGFEPEQVFRLLDFDADMAAAAYPLKAVHWDRISAAVKAGYADPEAAAHVYVPGFGAARELATRGEFARVPYVGGGFLMIRRAALLRMCSGYGALRYRMITGADHPLNDSPYRVALFDSLIEPETGLYLGEDFSFCRRWTDLGGEIWLDLHSKVAHVGATTFRGDLFAQLTRVAAKPDPTPADGML